MTIEMYGILIIAAIFVFIWGGRLVFFGSLGLIGYLIWKKFFVDEDEDVEEIKE